MVEWTTATAALDYWLRKYDLGGAKIIIEFNNQDSTRNAKCAFDYELMKECKYPATEYGKKPVYPQINGFNIEFTTNPGN